MKRRYSSTKEINAVIELYAEGGVDAVLAQFPDMRKGTIYQTAHRFGVKRGDTVFKLAAEKAREVHADPMWPLPGDDRPLSDRLLDVRARKWRYPVDGGLLLARVA